ncbi:hypothetical protein [Diplocloster modestus]|uniref:Uncharacterized protein n=1 Tax=Diplocloster modestus TaxID=2850322 RepID=A0ABS6K657_9FIRM|nr:hypothetical protein [Diplocloster modestus]MBU9726005.1 hypothetical protein [Diplocloster modestus]
MQMIIYASIVLTLVILGAAALLIIRNQPKERGELCLHETWMTAFLGVLLVVMGFVICWMKLTDANTAGTGAASYLFVAGFQLVSQLLGTFCMLFTFVKKTLITSDRIIIISFMGKTSELKWEDVVRVDKPMTKKALKFTLKNGDVITLGGESKEFARFVEIAKEKIRPAQGRELLNQIETRLGVGK